MRIERIKQNPSLLSIITDLNKEEISEILSEAERYCFPSDFHSNLVDSFINLYKGSLPTGFNKLSDRELTFLIKKNKDFIFKLDIINLSSFIINENFLSSSDVNYILSTVGLDKFNNHLLESILLNYHNLDIINELKNDFIIHLIRKNSKLLDSGKFISNLKIVPNSALKFIKDYVLLFKVENIDKEIIKNKGIERSSNFYNLYKNVYYLEESYFYKDIELINFIEKELYSHKNILSSGLFNLLKIEHKVKMFESYPEENFLRALKIEFSDLSREIISTLLKSEHYFDLNLISDMSVADLQYNYSFIRKRILNNEKIGKQSLKYFLIKNKDKLDFELLHFSIKKYPKFLNSLKCKDDGIKKLSLSITNFDKYTEKHNINFQLLITNDSLTEEEKIFLSSKIEDLIKMKIPLNINEYSKNLILNYLNKD